MKLVEFNGVKGLVLDPALGLEERRAFIYWIDSNAGARVVFINFVTARWISMLVGIADGMMEVIKFVTLEKNSYTGAFIKMLGTRLIKATCKEDVVVFNEWKDTNVDAVVFPDDSGSMTSFLIGCGQSEDSFKPKIMGSGELVFDRKNSHLHMEVANILQRAIARIESRNRSFIIEEVDFGRPIGGTICVPTGPNDKIVWAKRFNRQGLSRFVLDREPTECTSCVVILKKAADLGGYVLITAFIGHISEPEPWDINNFSQQADPAEAERRSKEFWASHALVWGSENTISGTETETCPW